MSQYVVTDTELTAVADAIRSKGGTEADLEWPSEFVSAIGAITTGGGGIPLLTRAQWTALTTVQKKAYDLVVIQDTSSGFDRGELVNGADYIGSMIQSGSGSDSSTFTVNMSGTYQLLILALNSEASSYDLNIGVTQNGTSVTGQTLDTNSYSNSGSNRRNYRLNVYDIECDYGDEISIVVTNRNNYSRVVYALCDTNVTTLDQAMTTPDGPTSGSYNDDAIVLYGTCDGTSSTQTINFDIVEANNTVQTANPGNNYKSSYIFWLS